MQAKFGPFFHRNMRLESSGKDAFQKGFSWRVFLGRGPQETPADTVRSRKLVVASSTRHFRDAIPRTVLLSSLDGRYSQAHHADGAWFGT